MYCSKEKDINKFYSMDGVHTPDEMRVIGSLRNSKQFQETFSCKPGDKMYDEEICEIW